MSRAGERHADWSTYHDAEYEARQRQGMDEQGKGEGSGWMDGRLTGRNLAGLLYLLNRNANFAASLSPAHVQSDCLSIAERASRPPQARSRVPRAGRCSCSTKNGPYNFKTCLTNVSDLAEVHFSLNKHAGQMRRTHPEAKGSMARLSFITLSHAWSRSARRQARQGNNMPVRCSAAQTQAPSGTTRAGASRSCPAVRCKVRVPSVLAAKGSKSSEAGRIIFKRALSLAQAAVLIHSSSSPHSAHLLPLSAFSCPHSTCWLSLSLPSLPNLSLLPRPF